MPPLDYYGPGFAGPSMALLEQKESGLVLICQALSLAYLREFVCLKSHRQQKERHADELGFQFLRGNP